MYNLLELCCMCLQNKTLLYNLNMIDREDKIKLIEKFNFCVFDKNHIDEKVSRNICEDCKHHVKSAYKFKKMCIKNYNSLKTHVTQQKNKVVEKEIDNQKLTVNKSSTPNKIVEHGRSVSHLSLLGKTKNSEMCFDSNENSSKYRKIIERRKTIAITDPSSDKSPKQTKIVEHKKSILIKKTAEAESAKKYSLNNRQTKNYVLELLATAPVLESYNHEGNNNQTNNRRASFSEPELIVNPPKEITNNIQSITNQNDTSLSFNRKYYGFTMSEIQSAHEYLFNVKILLKLVTVSSVIDTINTSDVLNTRIRLRSQKNLYKKVLKVSTDNISKRSNENSITTTPFLVQLNDDKNKQNNIENSSCMKDGFEEKLKDAFEFIDESSADKNQKDEDSNNALQNNKLIMKDHEEKRSFPAPRDDDKYHQIYPYISKQIDSAQELSKIVSDPEPLKKKTHMLPVLPTESLKPENLGNSFKQFNKAMNDVRTTLNRNEDYECQFCDRTFTKKLFLLLHYIVHCEKEGSFYKCPICKDNFKDEPAMKQHLITHYSKPTPRCYICKKVFTREYALALHILASHKGIRSFKCHICDKSFARSCTLKVHLRCHTAYKRFQCKICEKYFSQKVGLQRHMAIHTGQKPYACKVCQSSFAYRSQLTDHVVRIHYNKELN